MRRELRGKITSPALLVMLFLMQLRINWIYELGKNTTGSYLVIFSPYPHVLFHRAALNQFVLQSLFILGIALMQLQDLTLGVVQLHKILIDPLHKPVKVLVDSVPQLPVMYKLSEVDSTLLSH